MLYPVELRADCRTNPGRGGEIRTPDILVPNQARYQATLHPEEAAFYFDDAERSIGIRFNVSAK